MIQKIDRAHKKLKENIGLMGKLWMWSLNHFFITFITLYVLSTISLIINQGAVSLIFGVMLLIYFIVYLSHKIRLNIERFLHHELKFGELVTAYITSALFIILLFAILYWTVAMSGTGYLKYGGCVDTGIVTRDVIMNDPNAVVNNLHYPYFSSTTFFTVGYGDICPMGFSKFIAVLNAFVGCAFNVLILAIAIGNYATTKNNGKG
jgi:hypothetical protein